MGNILSGRRAQGREGQPQGAEEHRRAPRRQRPGHQEPGHLGVAARPRPPQPRANGNCRLSHKKNAKPGDTQKATTDDLFNASGLYELGGAWVRFGGGASVSKVAFASDFSAVEIRNLPRGSTVAFVKELLEDVGVPTEGLDIDLFEQTAGNRSDAIVKAEDPVFAKTSSSKLATYRTYRDLQAYPVPPFLPASQRPQVDCRVVHCSWARPTRSARLFFRAQGAAVSLQKKAMEGTYTVLGSRVQASVEGTETGWVVQITGLSNSAEASDVMAEIPEPERPAKVLVKLVDCAYDLEYNASVVKTMLQRFGPVTRWVLPPGNNTQRFHAYALFHEELMARNAAAALDDKLLPFGKTTTLSVSIVASVQFKVLDKIYARIQPRISAQTAEWEREQTYFHEGRPEGDLRCLRLEGEHHASVARARQFVEKAMSGVIVRMEAKDLHSCSPLAQDMPTGVLLGNLEWACNVLIVPDLRRSLFRVYGDDELDRKTVEAIATVLQRRIPESHAIDLNGKDASSGMDCPACFCQPEEPIRMTCGHIFCGACFVLCCEAETRASGDFQIRCPAGTGRGGLCGKAFSLTELQETLPSEVFEQVLKKSFESYVSRRPAELAHCATPDCDQVYRITPPDSEHPDIFTCNKCLRSVCTICQNPHPGEPCPGLARDANSVLDKKTREQLGIKDCPRCSRMMEKSDGCDHMSCSCGAHVCWVCLSAFDSGPDCYLHLQRVHRGMYFH
ncbi:hypothetical protein HDV57DRAFT_523103 [Trichoderma longibrachiatum]